MYVLIVDNKSAHIERLKTLISEKLGRVTFSLHDPRELTPEHTQEADLVIISGGSGRSVVKNPQTFKRVIDFVTQSSTPTIGICLGAEALGVAYGGHLRELPVRRVGNVRINLDPNLSKSLGTDSVMVNEFHKWIIEDISKPLKSLASSKDGVEILKHARLPLWGLQFHPEVRRLNNAGHKIFGQILIKLGFEVKK